VVAGKEPAIGPTARTVAENVKRLRTFQNLNYTELSDRLLSVANWSVNAVGIRRIESGERRVTPDDLVCLSLALGVSPISLLMPYTPKANSLVHVTGLSEPVNDVNLWTWLGATKPLHDDQEWMAFIVAAWPVWMLADFNEQLQQAALRVAGDNWGTYTVESQTPEDLDDDDGNS
jgi:transcriptional regulator with XRE-family HTH domain